MKNGSSGFEGSRVGQDGPERCEVQKPLKEVFQFPNEEARDSIR